MTDKARGLLERVLAGMDRYGDIYPETLEEIRAYLADTNPSEIINSQEIDRSEPVAWISHNRFRFNADIEPIEHGIEVPLYLHPAPQRSFVRLSDEKVMTMAWDDHTLALIQMVQDALKEKNK